MSGGLARASRPMLVAGPVAALVLALVAGCPAGGALPIGGSTPPTVPDGSAAAAPAPTTGVATAPPHRTAPPPTAGTEGPNDEVPGGPAWGERTLTGTVHRAGSCTMLLVGTRQWALIGPVADSLTVGQRVRVTGQVIATPASCSAQQAAQAVQVTRAYPA